MFKPLFSIINLEQLQFSGGHVGHHFRDWRPTALGTKNFSFIRGNFLIFNLNFTLFFVQKAFLFLKQVSRKGSIVLYVDSGIISSSAVKSAAIFADVSYVTNLWVGGTLTNFRETVYKFLKKSLKLSSKSRRYKVGLSRLDFVPELVVCSSEFYLPFAINESNKLLIPSLATVDSNIKFIESTYPVLLNDDSFLTTKSLFFIYSSSYWFGRADFAMRHLSIINEFIIAFVLKKFNIEKVFNFSNKILNFWLKRLKIQAKFISPSVFKLLNIFI